MERNIFAELAAVLDYRTERATLAVRLVMLLAV
jgi:hypothetical protein